MNIQIRRLGLALMVGYLAVFLMLNYVQVVRSAELNDAPENSRAIVRDFTQPRGDIVTADGVVIARSVPVDDEFERQREYPEGVLFGHLTGFFSFTFGSEGLERTYNDELAGRTIEQELRSVSDLFVDRDRSGDLSITVRHDMQQVARDALGERKGSVVAVDPRDGSVLAFWTFPSYDPNGVSSHVAADAKAVRDLLLASPDQPLLAKMYRETFFPGSTFKVVTGSAGLETGAVTPDEPVYGVSSGYTPPLTNLPINNFGGSSCGGALFAILRDSCNTAFAEMGAETIGPPGMIAVAESFGFNDAPPIDLPFAADSNFPTDFERNIPALAQSAIGQNDVKATPLQMALVAGAVANQGVIMAPHLLDQVRDADGNVVRSADPGPWRRAVSAPTASTMRQAMIGVVEGGTAAALRMSGVEVGAKTGTAQLTGDGSGSHAWIIAFAGPPGEASEVAIAVVVEGTDDGPQQTGGRVAAPVARAVLEALLAEPAG